MNNNLNPVTYTATLALILAVSLNPEPNRDFKP